MTEGCISDIKGDETVMDSPVVTVSIDLSEVPDEQVLPIMREAGLDGQDPCVIGEYVKGDVGEYTRQNVKDAEFHLPLGPGLTVLAQMNVIDIPEQPPEVQE